MAGSNASLREPIERAESWPRAAQEELLSAGLEIESGTSGGYLATSEELEAIDLADRAPVATDDEVEKAFAKQLGAGTHAHDDRSVGQAQLTGKVTLTFEPIGLATDGDSALLDATMRLVEVDDAVEAGGRASSK